MPLDAKRVATLWTRIEDTRAGLKASAATPDNPSTAEPLLGAWLKAEAGLDFGDERDQPAAQIHDDQRVGVLLPLRIETRFHKAAGDWVLQLRLFPEPVAFDQRPRPAPGETRKAQVEQRALKTFWATAAGALNSAEAPAAFRVLADLVGAARAAWLVRHVKVAMTPQGPDVDPVPAPDPAFASLPRRLGVWLARGGGNLQLAKTLDVDAAAIAEQSTIDKVADTDSRFDAFWWNNFAVAREFQLACEINLGAVADIDLLLVVGLGDMSAADLFAAHAEAGRLGLLPPGTATNTVDAAPTIATELDADAWFDLVRRIGWTQAGTRHVATCLTGDAKSLPALPAGDVDVRTSAQRAACLLMPGIFGRALHDEWALGPAAHAAERWATRWLLPGGAYPVIRVGDVPYGVLPVASAAQRWKVASDDPSLEGAILRHVEKSAAIAADVAEARDTLLGANAERVLDQLVRMPVSPGWVARPAMPLPLVAVATAGTIAGGSAVSAEQIFADAARQVVDVGLAPSVPVVAIGDAIPIERERVDRNRLDHHDLADLAFTPWSGHEADNRAEQTYHGEALFGIARRRLSIKRHLVEYLVDASMVLTHARIARVLAGGDGSINLVDASALEHSILLSATPAVRQNIEASGPLGVEVVRAWDVARSAFDAFMRKRHEMTDLVDAALGLLDTASHRADAWATGVADRRMRRLATAGVPFVIGAYGWVDRPAPSGTPGDRRPGPGPTKGGLVHAPGASHAATAALLRDRSIHAPGGLWDIALDSQRIRSALCLAAYIRAGITLAEALGRECERIIAAPERVHELRRAFPQKLETAGRQVCHGEEVMAAAAPGHPRHADLTNPPISATASQLNEIRLLQDAIDAYADLLVTDAAFALVGGQGRLAAESLDAAAGLGPPPELRAIRTPRRGTTAFTTLFGIVPTAQTPADAGPSGIAVPELAAEFVRRFGGVAAWTWERATQAGWVAIGLDDLDLDPVDVLTIDDRALVALLGRAAPLRSTGGAERVAAARRLAAALTGTLDAPQGLPSLSGARANNLVARAVADLALLAAFAGGDPADNLLVIAARWGAPITAEDFADTEAGAAARAAIVTTTREELSRKLTQDKPADPTAVRIRNLLGANVPVPAAVGSPATLGIAGATARADLDRLWLEPLTAVRAEVAAIEAHQLAPGPGSANPLRLRAWTAGLAPWDVPTKGNDHTKVIYGPTGALASPTVALWVRGTWSEVVPLRAHTTYAAFGFNAPDSRAPQSVLTVVPPDVSRPLNQDDLVAAISWVRTLAHARVVSPWHLRAPGVAAEVTPATLLHAAGALHDDPGGSGTASHLPQNFMIYERLEPDTWPDVEGALRAPVADPLWLLGRQWQFGEHRGEDASSPVELKCHTSTVVLRSLDRHFGRPGSPAAPSDPSIVPAEALIEADPSSWWTMGRRIRLGMRAAARLDQRHINEANRQPLRFPPLPPPYQAHSGGIDGRAVYQAGFFAGDPIWAEVATTPPDHWRPDRLDYTANMAAERGRIQIQSHDGGEVDWWSGDTVAEPALPIPISRSVVPGRLRYPGSPLPRYWQIEDDARDPSGFPPDAPHWATALWTDAMSSASGDWFTAPVPTGNQTSIGTIVTLHGARVRDSFDQWWELAFPPGLGDQPEVAGGSLWSIYRMRGLPAGSLVLWPTAVAPLTSLPWEEALLGVDEDADLCWAVETRIDGLAYDPGFSGAPPANAAEDYLLTPSWGIPPHGHPYRIEPGGAEGRRFVQGLVADLSSPVPRLRPGPRTTLLSNRSLVPGHELRPSAVPSVGVRLVRKWRLARSVDGRPVLWLQTERLPLIVGPVSHLRFDVLLPDRRSAGG
jgi:hypothetical protein